MPAPNQTAILLKTQPTAEKPVARATGGLRGGGRRNWLLGLPGFRTGGSGASDAFWFALAALYEPYWVAVRFCPCACRLNAARGDGGQQIVTTDEFRVAERCR